MAKPNPPISETTEETPSWENTVTHTAPAPKDPPESAAPGGAPEKPPWEDTVTHTLVHPDVSATSKPVVSDAKPSEPFAETVISDQEGRVHARQFGAEEALFESAKDSPLPSLPSIPWVSMRRAVVGLFADLRSNRKKQIGLGVVGFLLLVFLIGSFWPGGSETNVTEETVPAAVEEVQVPANERGQVQGQETYWAAMQIRTQPVGAKVFVDGVLQNGVTPLVVEGIEPATEHNLIMEKEGFDRLQTNLTLNAGEKRFVSFQLFASAVELRVESNPSGANVLLNGQDIGKTPLKVLVDSEQADVLLEIKRSGYQTFADRLSIGTEAVYIVQDLQKAPAAVRFGYLTLEAEPWAIVYINDQRINRITPIRDYQVKPGRHVLRFENPQNNKREIRRVKIDQNQRLRVKVNLR